MNACPALLRCCLATLLLATLAVPAPAQEPSRLARAVADYARATYAGDTVSTLADLVAFATVNEEGTANADDPNFRAMSAYLGRLATKLGLDFADHGAVVVVGLGDAPSRLGVITHGDVQPADASKWAQDPFRLDVASEPGKLIGRGTEDDKGPIATALYAMAALRDRQVPLQRRIELIISYTEESDWEPFETFVAAHPPPDLNVAIDSDYPVVVAEKGWCSVYLTVPAPSPAAAAASDQPVLVSFTGGSFLSQIPEDAEARIEHSTPDLERTLLAAARRQPEIRFRFEPGADSLRVSARGLAAHSSTPWAGRNAITHLAALLGSFEAWADTPAARMVHLVNDLVGTGDYGEKFGDVAYEHPFMGKLTLALDTLETEPGGGLKAGINLRRPVGRSREEVEASVSQAVEAWQQRTGLGPLDVDMDIGDPYYLADAPHIPVLLGIFRAYTGQADAAPISIGGGTQARLVPYGVNFGPAMPGAVYTGHTEHEFITRDQLLLNLEMYTAMLVELAGAH